MELLEQQRAPVGGGLTQGRVVQRGPGLASPQGPGDVGLAQQPFQAAVVALLVGAAGGAAPVQLQVELIAPHRQPGRQGLQLGQVLAQAAVALGQGLGLVLPELQLLEHLGGGATAVVAHARQPEGPIQARAGLPLEPVALHRHRVAAGADRGRG